MAGKRKQRKPELPSLPDTVIAYSLVCRGSDYSPVRIEIKGDKVIKVVELPENIQAVAVGYIEDELIDYANGVQI